MARWRWRRGRVTKRDVVNDIKVILFFTLVRQRGVRAERMTIVVSSWRVLALELLHDKA
jgi:hypothetical protein